MDANMQLVKDIADAIMHIKYCKSGDAPCIPCGKAALLLAQALADSVFASKAVSELSRMVSSIPKPNIPTL